MDKSPCYCLYCLKKEMPLCSFKNEDLQELMHDKIISSPHKIFITNTKNKLLTPDELYVLSRIE